MAEYIENLVHVVQDYQYPARIPGAENVPSLPGYTQDPSPNRLGLWSLSLELREMIYKFAIQDEAAVVTDGRLWDPINSKPTILNNLAALQGPAAAEVKNYALANSNWIFRRVAAVTNFINQDRIDGNDHAAHMRNITVMLEIWYAGGCFAEIHPTTYDPVLDVHHELQELKLDKLTLHIYLMESEHCRVTSTEFFLEKFFLRYPFGFKAGRSVSVKVFRSDEDGFWWPYDWLKPREHLFGLPGMQTMSVLLNDQGTKVFYNYRTGDVNSSD